jgi:hypothetical protein
LAEQIAALGAVTLRDAAVAEGIDPASAGVRAKRGLIQSAFRGPRGVWCVRPAEFHAECQQWRCTWEEGCERYAPLSANGRCHEHAACVERDGRLTAEEFAAKYGLYPPYLNARLEAGDIPSTRVERGGRPAARMVDESVTLRVIRERFRCKAGPAKADEQMRWDDDGGPPFPDGFGGCNGYALGPSGYCSDHATGAASTARARGKVLKVCAQCGRERDVFPSLQRSGDLCLDCWMDSKERAQIYKDVMRGVWDNRYAQIAETGLKRRQEVAAELGLAPTSSSCIRARGIRTERLQVNGYEFEVYHAEDEELEALMRDWVRGGDGRRRSWFEPDHAEARLSGRGALARAVRELRERIKARRKWLRSLSGRKRKDELREQLREIASEVIKQHSELGDLSEISLTSFLAEIGLLAWQRDLTDFRERYPAARGVRGDPDAPARGWRKSIADRVRGLIGDDAKALLIATKKLQDTVS